MDDLREYAERVYDMGTPTWREEHIALLVKALQALREACVVAAIERMETEGDGYYDDALEDAILTAVPEMSGEEE